MTARTDVLARARSLGPSDDVVRLAGDLARLSCADVEGDDALVAAVDEADAILAKWGSEGRAAARKELPDTSSIRRFLGDPRGPHALAIEELDDLGRVTAGLVALDPEGDATKDALARVATLAADVARVARERSAEMLDAAVSASERIAAHGVFPGADDALVALSDVVGARLDAALRGEPMDAPAPLRAKTMDAALARSLGESLARALRRTVDVAPDLLELAPRMTRGQGSDLVLHEQTEALARPIEILRGVKVSRRDDEIEIELAETPKEAPLLVPIERGEPGKPLRSRGGATPRHVVFTLEREDVDGWALVIGDRVAFLRRR